jgi:hypothetical protein
MSDDTSIGFCRAANVQLAVQETVRYGFSEPTVENASVEMTRSRSRTVHLRQSGVSITVELDGNWLNLSGDERKFVFMLIDLVSEYDEKAKVDERELRTATSTRQNPSTLD